MRNSKFFKQRFDCFLFCPSKNCWQCHFAIKCIELFFIFSKFCKHHFVKPTNSDLTKTKNLMSFVSNKTCDISIFQRSPGRGSQSHTMLFHLIDQWSVAWSTSSSKVVLMINLHFFCNRTTDQFWPARCWGDWSLIKQHFMYFLVWIAAWGPGGKPRVPPTHFLFFIFVRCFCDMTLIFFYWRKAQG